MAIRRKKKNQIWKRSKMGVLDRRDACRLNHLLVEEGAKLEQDLDVTDGWPILLSKDGSFQFSAEAKKTHSIIILFRRIRRIRLVFSLNRNRLFTSLDISKIPSFLVYSTRFLID